MNSFCQVLHVALLVALNVKASCFQPRPAVPVAAAGVGPGRQRSIGAFPLRVGTGMAFDDGDQILVSAQKPLGIVLEEADEGGGRDGGGVVVADISDPASSAVAAAGVQRGDLLVAIQNVDVTAAPIKEVLERIGNAPRVVNLRFQKAA